MSVRRTQDSREDITGRFIPNECSLPIIIILVVLGLSVSILCLTFQITIIFQNLLYLPIIIVATYYPRKSLVFCGALSAAYLALMILIPRDWGLVPLALIRIVIFFAVSEVVAYLSRKRTEAERALVVERNNLNRIVGEQTKLLARDLEESKRVERAYRDTSESLELLISSSAAPIAVWNSDYYLTRVNRSFELVTGRAADDLIGRNIRTLSPPQFRRLFAERMESVELDLLHGDGSVRHTLWHSSPIPTDGAGQGGAIAYVQDITRLKHLEERCRRLQAELDSASGASGSSGDPDLLQETFRWK